MAQLSDKPDHCWPGKKYSEVEVVESLKQLVDVVAGAVMRPALYGGTDPNFVIAEEMGPFATRYQV